MTRQQFNPEHILSEMQRQHAAQMQEHRAATQALRDLLTHLSPNTAGQAIIFNSKPWPLNFKGRRHAYVWLPAQSILTLEYPGMQGIGLTFSSGWNDFDYPEGTQFTAATSVTGYVRLTNELMAAPQPSNEADVQNINLAQVLGLPMNTANPIIDMDQIRALILAGQGYSVTTGLISSATNNILFGGLQIFVNNIAKSIFIYWIDILDITTSGDSEVRSSSALDPGLNGASPPTPVNLRPGSSNTSLATIAWTAPGFTAGSALPGNLQWQGASAANAHQFPITIPGDGHYLKAGDIEGIATYAKLPTAGQTYAITMRYVEGNF